MKIEFPAMAVQVEQIPRDQLEDAYGYFQLHTQKIGINAAIGPDLERSTLLHEVIHGCLHNQGIHLEEEEFFINSLSPPLLFVLQNNPHLVAYLTDRAAPLFPESDDD